jgi:hypothetical protein
MIETLAPAIAAVTITALACFAGLRAWRGWLELRRHEIASREPGGGDNEDVGLRIELAAVRERLKKLEAIASGVEL